MFGRQDENTNTSNSDVNAIDAAVGALTNSTNSPPPSNPEPAGPMTPTLPATPPAMPPAAPDNDIASPQVPPSDLDVRPGIDLSNRDVLSPAGGFPMAPSQKSHNFHPEETPPPNDEADTTDQDDDLAALKIQALDELYPLFDKLDLEPEEKFRTLMMMIQASDNQELIKSAYAAAHSIDDDKEKAQALLDIINEINYFTQQPPVDN
jgi:hypothetical protein